MNSQVNRPARRPYMRPMGKWWERDPFFIRYMWREITAVIVMVYAIVCAVGIVRLSQGEAAWNGFLEALRSPWSLVAHMVMLAGMLYHTYSWFEIMPKTMPAMVIDGKRVSATTITTTGLLVAAAAGVLLLLILWGLAP